MTTKQRTEEQTDIRTIKSLADTPPTAIPSQYKPPTNDPIFQFTLDGGRRNQKFLKFDQYRRSPAGVKSVSKFAEENGSIARKMSG